MHICLSSLWMDMPVQSLTACCNQVHLSTKRDQMGQHLGWLLPTAHELQQRAPEGLCEREHEQGRPGRGPQARHLLLHLIVLGCSHSACQATESAKLPLHLAGVDNV